MTRLVRLATILTVIAALPTAALAGPLDGRIVVIDPGHNGGNSSHPSVIAHPVWAGTGRKACDTEGAATRSGLTEAGYNLAVARAVRRILERWGARVALTRPDNHGVGPCVNRRAAVGNRLHADVAVSIHADGGPAGGRGFHVIHPGRIRGLTDDIFEDSRELAYLLRNTVRRGTDMPIASYVGRGGIDVRGDLAGLNLSDVPKVFIETGNMANALDARLLESHRYRSSLAWAIARAVRLFLRAHPGPPST